MSESNSKLWYFQNFNLMDALSEEEKLEISNSSGMKNQKKKEIVYFSHEEASMIFFLKKGKVKISKYSKDGKELILGILGPGEIFGESGMTSTGVRDEVAEVMEDAVICSLPIEEIKKMLSKNAMFNLSITKLIGFRYKKIQSRLESLVFKTISERVRDFISEMAQDHGRTLATGKEIEVKLKLTHEDIAKLTATTRQSVTTVLSALEKEKIIAYDRKRILILEPNLL